MNVYKHNIGKGRKKEVEICRIRVLYINILRDQYYDNVDLGKDCKVIYNINDSYTKRILNNNYIVTPSSWSARGESWFGQWSNLFDTDLPYATL